MRKFIVRSVSGYSVVGLEALIAAHAAMLARLQAEYAKHHYSSPSNISRAARRYKALGLSPRTEAVAAKSKKDKKAQSRKIGRNIRKRSRRIGFVRKNAASLGLVRTAADDARDQAIVQSRKAMSASAIALIGSKLAAANAALASYCSPGDPDAARKTAAAAIRAEVSATKGSSKVKPIELPAPKAAPIRGTVVFRKAAAFVVGSTITGGPCCRLPKVKSPWAGIGFGTNTKTTKCTAGCAAQAAALATAVIPAARRVPTASVGGRTPSTFLARARAIRRKAEAAWKSLAGFVMQAGQSPNSTGEQPEAGGTAGGANSLEVNMETPTTAMDLGSIVSQYIANASPDAPMIARTSRSLWDVLSIKDPVGAVYGAGMVKAEGSLRTLDGIRYGLLKLLCQMTLRGNIPLPVNVNRPLPWFNHHWTQEDLIHVCGEITKLAINSGKSYVTMRTEGPDAKVFFDAKEQRFLSINSRGVFVGDRELEVLPLLLVATTAKNANGMCFLNSYGVTAFFLLTVGIKYLFVENSSGRGQVIFAEKFFDEVLLGKSGGFPVTNENEVGVLDGDRSSYTKYATQSRFFEPGTAVLCPTYLMTCPPNADGKYGYCAGINRDVANLDWAKTWEMEEKAYSYEALIFECFNLVSHKPKPGVPNTLIDGRKVCVRISHMPEGYQSRYLRKVVESNLGTSDLPALAAELGARVLPEHAEAWLIDNLVVTLSNKVNKLVKRCVMDSALVGQILESEGRGFEVFGQEMSTNCALIPSCVSLTLIAAAGAAMHWGDKPVLMNSSTSRRQPGFKPFVGENGEPVMEWEYAPSSTTVENGMFVARWDYEVPLTQGDIVGRMPYTTLSGDTGYVDITADRDRTFLRKVTYGMQRVAGAQEDLVIKYETYSLETSMKARSFEKAMMVHYHDGVLKNGNGDAYAEALFPRDTNKWTDLVLGCVDIAAATFIHNKAHPSCAHGYSLVLKANKLLGITSGDRLVYHPTLALVGVYKEIQSEFEAVFGRAVWATWNCGREGAWALHLNAQYVDQSTGNPVDGWSHISPSAVGVELSEKAQVITCIAQVPAGSEITKQDNILLVVLDNGHYHVVQRGWSYIGTKDCPVIVPVKFELASVNSAVSTTRLMAGVARNVYAQNPELGMALLREGSKYVQLSATHVALSRGAGLVDERTGTPLFRRELLTPNGFDGEFLARTKAAVREEIANCSDPSKLLKAFAKRFSKVIFTFRSDATDRPVHFSVWFPALFEQDASMDYRSQDSLSALIRALFVYISTVEEVDPAALGLLLSRIQASYAKLAKSKSVVKASSFGRRAAQAKPVGIPEVPMGEIWIKGASHGRSVCHVFKTVGIRHGVQTAIARAPMTEAAFVETVVINGRQSQFEWMADDVVYMNNMVSAIHGGDYDGDSNVFVRADEVAMAKLELARLYTLVRERTGSDQLAHTDANGRVSHGGLYYADHFEIKSLKSLGKKMGVQKVNFCSVATLGGLLVRSTQTLGEAVGKVHGAALYADLLNTFLSNSSSKRYSLTMIRIMYEVYEIPLAGLDEALYELCYGNNGDNLLSTSTTDLRDDAARNKRAELAAAAGMNSQQINDIYNIVHERLNTSAQLTKYPAAYVRTGGTEVLGRVVAHVCVELSKGRFTPGLEGYGILVDYLREHLELDVENPTVWALSQYLRYTAVALEGGSLAIDVSLFADNGEGNDNGGGGSPAPSPAPSGNGGDGGAVTEVVAAVETPNALGGYQALEGSGEPSSVGSIKVVSVLEEDAEVPEEEEEIIFLEGCDSLLEEAIEWRQSLDVATHLNEWGMVSDDQLIALWRICKQDAADCVTLSGRAGSGKTFVVDTCRKVLQCLHIETIVVGSTGVAASNVNGEGTLNSFVGLGVGDVLPLGKLESAPERGRRRRKKMSHCVRRVQQRLARGRGPVVVFIEEVSMCSAETLLLAYQAVTEACRILGRTVRFVCVGDLRQLKVVDVTDGEANWQEYRNVPFQRAHFSLNKGDGTTEELTYGSLLSDQGPFLLTQGLASNNWRAERISLVTNHRQKTDDKEGAAFLEALNALGDGAPLSDPRLFPIAERIFVAGERGYESLLGGEVIPSDQLEESLHVFFSNLDVKNHNRRRMEKLRDGGAASKVYVASVVPGEWTHDQIVREMQPVEERTLLCEGMRFMVRINVVVDGTNLANGTLGTVVKLYRDSFDLELPDGEVVRIQETEYPMPIASSGNPVGRVRTAAIGHAAYGSTAWKTQGLTIKEAPGAEGGFGRVVLHIDRPKAEHGLLYTVCSRVQRASQLVIVAKSPSDVERMAFADPAMKGFIAESEAAMQSFLENKVFKFATESRVVNGTESTVHQVYYQGRKYAVNSRGLAYYYEGGWKIVDDEQLVAILQTAL